MISWITLSWSGLKCAAPMRLPGTCRQYSKKAMPQLTRMTFQSASWRYFKWPYQAKVMKMLEKVRRTIVHMEKLDVARPTEVADSSTLNPCPVCEERYDVAR